MPFPEDTAYRAPAWLPGGHLQTIYTSLIIRVPAVAYRRERLELPDGDFLDIDWMDGQTGCPRRGAVPRPGRQRRQPLRTQPHGPRPGAWLAWRGGAFPRLLGRGQPVAARLLRRRQRGHRTHPAPRQIAAPCSAGSCCRRLARRQCAAEMAGRTGRVGAPAGRTRGRHLGAARSHRGRPHARPWLQPPCLHRALPPHPESQGAAQGRALPRGAGCESDRRRHHLPRIRHAGHRAAAWLSRCRGLLAAGVVQAAAENHRRAHARHQREKRSFPARLGVAQRRRGLACGHARAARQRRPCRLPVRALPRQHRLAAATG